MTLMQWSTQMVQANVLGFVVHGSYYVQEATSLSLSLSLEMQCLLWEVCMFYHFPFLSS